MKVKTSKRIQEIEESLKVLAKYMKEEHARLEAEIERSGTKEISEIKKRLEEHSEPMETGIEKKLQQEVARLEGLIYSIPKENLLKEYSEGMKISEDLKKSVDLRLQVIEGKIKNTAQDIISSKLEDFQTLQERFKRLDERVSNAVTVLENLKASRDDDHSRRLEKRINERLEEMQEQFRKDDRSDSREYKKLQSEIAELRETEKNFARKEDLKGFNKFSEDLEGMENRMKHFQRKEDLTRTFSEVKERFEEFEAKMKRIVTKEDLEIGNVRKMIEGEMKAAAQKTNSSDSKKLYDEMTALSQRIAALENSHGDEQDLMDVRSDVDDIDNRLVEIEMNIKDLKTLETKTMKALEHLENFDRDTKAESMKFVTAQLSEFAKHVDRKLPAVVTRDDFTRSMIELNHRISTLETPDFTYVNRRMQALEGKVNEIYSLLKSFSSSIPVVVE
ncbi:MAG: hypothetical protein HYW27_01795 [Candidatus Aenigmarchaeota archaeon]|nr:hypothetical protein [Candidatus Aenigmarchaeota archaeon]